MDLKIAQTRRVLPLYKREQQALRRGLRPCQPAGAGRGAVQDEPRARADRRRGRQADGRDPQAGRGERRHAEGHGASSRTWRVGLEDGSAPPSAASRTTPTSRTRPVVKYIQKILTDAISAGASDIHFEPYERYFRVRYRIDGILIEITQPPLAIKDKVASRIKVISRLDISEKRVPQDGRMKLVLSKAKAIDFRVSHAADALRREDRDADPRLERHQARHRGAGLRGRPAGGADARDRPAVRDDPGHGPDRQRQDGVALHLPQHPEPARRQHLDRRGPCGNPAPGRQPGQRQRQGGAYVRGRAARRSCGRIRTSSWSAKSATSRPPTSRSRPRRRATSCCRRCTRTTRPRRSRACSTWAWRRSTSHRRSSSSPRSASAAGCARTARSPRTFRRKRCCAPASPRKTSTAPGSLTAPSAAITARARATRAASASTRSCRSPTTCASSSCATATRSTSREQAQKEGVRDLRQSGLLKVKAGITSLEEIEAITNE